MKTLLFENDEIKFELEDGILIATWKAVFLDKALVKKIINHRLEVLKGKSYPFLSNIKSIKNSTKEARDFLASKEGCQGALSVAILINSQVSKMIANFFIGYSKPFIPTRMFTDEAEAKKWLQLK